MGGTVMAKKKQPQEEIFCNDQCGKPMPHDMLQEPLRGVCTGCGNVAYLDE
jgi:hypothetical protein